MPARPFAWAARCFCRLRPLRTASSSRQNCSETNLPAVVMLSKRSSEMNPSAFSRSAFSPATRSMYSGNLPAAGVNSKMTAIIDASFAQDYSLLSWRYAHRIYRDRIDEGYAIILVDAPLSDPASRLVGMCRGRVRLHDRGAADRRDPQLGRGGHRVGEGDARQLRGQGPGDRHARVRARARGARARAGARGDPGRYQGERGARRHHAQEVAARRGAVQAELHLR